MPTAEIAAETSFGLATPRVQEQRVTRSHQDICWRCGLTWQAHLDAKAANCPFLVEGEHLPTCREGQPDPIARTPWPCSCRVRRGPAITRIPVGA